MVKGTKNKKRMAFEMAAQAAVNVDSINYDKYLRENRGAQAAAGLGESSWVAVVPLSLKGGGSIRLGFYSSKEVAKEKVRDYFNMLLDERGAIEVEVAEAKVRCSGCRDDMTNQEAHYGGCMSESEWEDEGMTEREVIIEHLRERIIGLERAVVVENLLVGKLKKRYNVSETEIGELMGELMDEIDDRLDGQLDVD
jgi:hypothetical protein